MVSDFILPIAVAICAGAGAFSAYIGWLRSDEPFSGKKFASGVVTGVIAGIALVIANSQGLLNAVDDVTAWILIGTLALSIVGADVIRTGISAAVARRANPQLKNTR